MIDFSIVIPTYKHPELARKAIASVLKQQGVTVQIIISDDSDNDEIASLCSSFSRTNLLYRHHEKRGNAVGNWNHGLGFAEGKYIILMHHDEYFESNNHLERLKKEFDAGADVVISNVKVKINGKEKRRFFPKIVKSFMLRCPSTLFAFNAIGPCACVAFARGAVPKFNERLSWLVDVEWYFRCLSHQKPAYLNDLYIVSQHGHQGQITQEINILQALKEDKKTVCGLSYCTAAIKAALFLNQTIQSLKCFRYENR